MAPDNVKPKSEKWFASGHGTDVNKELGACVAGCLATYSI